MARQLPLPLVGDASPSRILVGPANAAVLDALSRPESWPFRTAVLFGPARSGKSLLGRWFAGAGGEVADNAEALDEDALFHHWNRAQETAKPLLVIVNRSEEQGWDIHLPDLRSRMGGSLHLEVGPPDEAMLADLIALHAEMRGFALGPDAGAYLVPRIERSYAAAEQVTEAIDRISLERKSAPGPAIWRAALEELGRGDEPELF